MKCFFSARNLRVLFVVLLVWVLATPQLLLARVDRANQSRSLLIYALTARIVDKGVVLEWRSDLSDENLGFNIFREADGERVKLNREIVPGGVFLLSSSQIARRGRPFAFLDPLGTQDSVYLVEAVSTVGEVELSESVHTDSVEGKLKSGLVESITAARTDKSPSSELSYPTGSKELASNTGTLEDQWAIAAQPALKIDIKIDGWYRVTHAQSTAVGFNPAVDIKNLRLYGDGQEIAILTSKSSGQFIAGDYFEFFGRGLDTATSGRRTYYLTAGSQPGRRIRGELHTTASIGANLADLKVSPTNSVVTPSVRWFSFLLTFVTSGNTRVDQTVTPAVSRSPAITTKSNQKKKSRKKKGRREFSHPQLSSSALPANFIFTVEKKDRLIYFSSLINGETENYFGQVISASPVSQTLNIPNPDLAASTSAQLEVALQGVGTVQHEVDVSFNNSSTLGTLSYFGLGREVKSFNIPLSMLNNGSNSVTFTSALPGTTSLVDYVRLTYPHALRADSNRLRLSLRTSQTARVEGFTTQNIRVIDVTDPLAPRIYAPPAEASKGAFAIQISASPSLNKSRILYAQPQTEFDTPERFSLNQPSSLNATANGADLLIIAHKDLLSTVTPLVNLRQSQGLAVSVVNVEDIYDEFSFGVHGPQALKSFLSRTANWTKVPRYVLLVGDASLDPRNYQGLGDFDMVPTKLIDATFNETSSDDWISDFNSDGLPEIPIGRFPVRNVSEANLVISKVVVFTPATTPQSALLVADDPTNYFFNFEAANDQVQALLPAGMPVQRVNRRTDTDPHKSVVSGFNSGQSLVNYTGHGNVDTWMGASVFSSADAVKLTNAVSIVISQVYGGGGEAGATYRNDFVELFNRGAWPVRLGGWSLQYTGSTGTTWQVTNLPDVVVPPGKYFLVQQAQGPGGTTSLPTPDAQGSIDLNASAGKVALLNTTTALSGSGCPQNANVVDLVGYGGANCSLGSPTAALTTTTAALRNTSGCTDTRTNAADFSAAAPIPRNSASAVNNCLNASARLPLSFVVVMDCLNGYFQDPVLQGLAEALLKAPNGGGVAVFASSGLTVPDGQHAMNTQLFTLLYGSQSMPLGDAIKTAKAATTDIDVRRTWILFGDPSMKIR